MRKVTIEDISRETELSRGTVSRALNNRPDISVETRQRVLEACTRLKYSPSHAARTLATGRNFTVAVFVDDLDSPLSAAILRGVLGATGPRNYFAHLVELNPRIPAAERVQQVPAERVDGCVFVSTSDAETASALGANFQHRPIAASTALPGLVSDIFEPDLVEAGRVAGRYLSERGVKRIAYVSRGAPGATERLRGLRETLSLNGGGEGGIRGVEISVDGLGDLKRGDVDALVLDETELVIAALDRLGDRDAIPMVGLGEARWSAALRPWLTMIDYCGEEIGRRMAHALLQRIEGEREAPPQHVRVAPRLVQDGGTDDE